MLQATSIGYSIDNSKIAMRIINLIYLYSSKLLPEFRTNAGSVSMFGRSARVEPALKASSTGKISI